MRCRKFLFHVEQPDKKTIGGSGSELKRFIQGEGKNVTRPDRKRDALLIRNIASLCYPP